MAVRMRVTSLTPGFLSNSPKLSQTISPMAGPAAAQFSELHPDGWATLKLGEPLEVENQFVGFLPLQSRVAKVRLVPTQTGSNRSRFALPYSKRKSKFKSKNQCSHINVDFV